MQAITGEDARIRHIKRADMVACALAFIDCKMPGSERKLNYSLVGPGVTQSRDQVVNLTEAHGFSLGVAAMPPGTVNNLHVHFTAEVFMIQRGSWTFRWGTDDESNTVTGEPGDVISMPTWIFRGFSNTGTEDGWIFTALGGDDTGGIIWHPSILENAAHYGMFLTQDNMLVDTAGGTPRPPPHALMAPLSPEQIASLPHYSANEMSRRLVKAADRAWSRHALLDGCLPGHAAELAPVIGYGMSEDRAHAPAISNPHGFSVEWLRIPPNNQVGRHSLSEKQVLIVFKGTMEVTLNAPDGAIVVQVATGECFSAPAGVWRAFRSVGEEVMEVAVITAGDARKRITWSQDILDAALQAGAALDHDGHIAPLALLPPATRDAVIARMQPSAALKAAE